MRFFIEKNLADRKNGNRFAEILLQKLVCESQKLLYESQKLLWEIQQIKCPAVAFALRAKAPRYIGCAKNIIDTAGHFIFWKCLYKSQNLIFELGRRVIFLSGSVGNVET
ncbi:hypothetical protein COO91_03932 [Nostoc flagelliforme CCNUN1]|uniref:Uncharacterized protein n=1 Tax=Nostoc flagelliforme CCNUN1 TaxID=2038116 RepID=A0A2K8SRF3_9NOSO|nr:hypothetical protein COO91_03932 [Nostoc flagelliforme CCNUN1]